MNPAPWLLLVAIPFPTQDPDPSDLVRLFGAPTLEERDRTTQELLRLSLRARPALLKAAGGGEADIADRARGILDAIDKQLSSLVDVLDRRTKGDSASYHRLIRDLGETV